MTTQDNPDKKGNGKAWAAGLSGFLGLFTLNWLSLHGVNFETIGIPSEWVKAAIDGGFAWFLAWLTPDHVVDAIVDAIWWTRLTGRRIWNACTQPLQDMINKP